MIEDPLTRSFLSTREQQSTLVLKRPRIRIVSGPRAGSSLLLEEKSIVVGRGKKCDLVVEDDTISRRHFAIHPHGEHWSIKDLESKSGTQIDGLLIKEAILAMGATIQVGATSMIFEEAQLELPLLSIEDTLPRPPNCLGESIRYKDLFRTLKKVAPLELPVLLTGETGTGKEALARAVHDGSHRTRKPYVVVDCTLLDSQGLRSELFGHTKGAFTGAHADRLGAFREADGGTLFLDEVGEIPLDLQPLLLRVLQEGEVRPLGAGSPVRVDVRIVAATHRDLHKMVEASQFRADLLYRLGAIALEVPALKDRPGDVRLLANSFLPPGKRFSETAMARLEAHDWPGNVRELSLLVQATAALAMEEEIQPEELRFVAGPKGASNPKDLQEKARILEAIHTAGGNRSKAAKLLGMPRSTFYFKLKQFDIQ